MIEVKNLQTYLVHIAPLTPEHQNHYIKYRQHLKWINNYMNADIVY